MELPFELDVVRGSCSINLPINQNFNRYFRISKSLQNLQLPEMPFIDAVEADEIVRILFVLFIFFSVFTNKTFVHIVDCGFPSCSHTLVVDAFGTRGLQDCILQGEINFRNYVHPQNLTRKNLSPLKYHVSISRC